MTTPALSEVLRTDLPSAAAFAAVLLLLIGGAELLRRRHGISAPTTRRSIHALTGIAVFGALFVFQHPHYLYLIAGLFVVTNLVAVRRRWFGSMHAIDRTTYGTAIFPLALIIGLAFTWSVDAGRVFVLQAAFLVMGIADPLASAVGTRRRARGAYAVGSTVKTAAGSAAFLLSAFVLLLGALLAFQAWGAIPLSLTAIFGASAGVAIVATAAEALGGRGWDNLSIVIAVVVSLVFLVEHPEAHGRFYGGLALALLFGAAAWKLRFLDLSGAVAAGLFAVSVVAFGGMAWAVPAFAFFFLSSMLSVIRKSQGASRLAHDEKGSRRDAGQVYANGGIAWAALVAHVVLPHEIWYWVFAGSLAAATADTWATEIGTMARRTARHVVTWQRLPAGASGAVSIPGTLGGAAGAGVIASLAVLFFGGWAAYPVEALLIVTGAGIIGAVVDSFAGATVQAQYRLPDGRITERRRNETRANQLVRGFPWMTNDRVNWLCTLAGGLTAAGGYLALAAPAG